MQRKIVTVPQLERRTKESVKNVIIGLFVLVFPYWMLIMLKDFYKTYIVSSDRLKDGINILIMSSIGGIFITLLFLLALIIGLSYLLGVSKWKIKVYPNYLSIQRTKNKTD